MPGTLPHHILLALGGDVLQKYGTLIKRSAPPSRGGETAYTFTRTGTGLYLAQDGTVQTAAANVPRIDWGTDPITGLLQPYLALEGAAATNVVLRSRDLSNAAWTKVSITAALDQVGIDGGANTASSLLATGANGTCLQAITLGSSSRVQSAWVKRLVGSGTIQMTTDNGGTWTTVTLTTAWTRVTIPAQTLANPTVGFRLVTSGDKIAVDGVQNETTLLTSTIFTTTVALTRNAEVFTVPYYGAPGPLWRYTRFLERNVTVPGSGAGIVGLPPTNAVQTWPLDRTTIGTYRTVHGVGGSTVQVSVAPAGVVYGAAVEILELLNADGSVTLFGSANNGAIVSAGPSGALAFGTSAFGAFTLGLAGFSGGLTDSPLAVSRLLVGQGPGTLVVTLPEARAIPV